MQKLVEFYRDLESNLRAIPVVGVPSGQSPRFYEVESLLIGPILVLGFGSALGFVVSLVLLHKGITPAPLAVLATYALHFGLCCLVNWRMAQPPSEEMRNWLASSGYLAEESMPTTKREFAKIVALAYQRLPGDI